MICGENFHDFEELEHHQENHVEVELNTQVKFNLMLPVFLLTVSCELFITVFDTYFPTGLMHIDMARIIS